jgi:hypothetical protein
MERGKELATSLSKAPEKAIKIAAKALKDQFSAS